MSDDRPGGTAPHVIVADLDRPVLGDDDRHHLSAVRRLRPNDRLSVTDGGGSWRWCRFGDDLVVDGPIEDDPRPEPLVTIAFALTKGDKPELVVQKLTEIGVDVIVPFLSARSIVRWDAEKAERHHERLVRIAREASMQSRRTWLPLIEPVRSFDEVAVRPGATRADFDGEPITEQRFVMIGPEGGWDDTERAVPAVSLGDGVLRAETAAIVAGALMIDRRRST